MPEGVGFAVAAAAVGGVFWVLSRLVRRPQAGDPGERGRDPAGPGGCCPDTPPGPD